MKVLYRKKGEKKYMSIWKIVQFLNIYLLFVVCSPRMERRANSTGIPGKGVHVAQQKFLLWYDIN